jgi:hypothetical protein
MLKTDTLIFLINSMTQSEKKAFKLSTQRINLTPGYVSLFDMISKNRQITSDNIRQQFQLLNKNKSFDATVNYLYKSLLDTLLALRIAQDSYYKLFNSIMKARILFEKSLFDECFELLNKVIEDGRKQENYYALLLASKLELEYLLALNFPLGDEKTLLNKHYKINEILSIIRKINEQASLYELLKYRVGILGNVRSQQQKANLNDLVVSEMSILASSNIENFEINKLHQLFQANYLISVGDYKSALRSYMELSSLFERNKHLWNNPPIYYLLSIEGVLDSLRSIRNYEGMHYFIEQLKKLETPSVNFNANVKCLIFLYELFPFFDKGNFNESAQLLEIQQEQLFAKINLLNPNRQAELCLYSALIYYGKKDYKKSHKYVSMIMIKGKSYYYMPLYRTIRLVNLMILYELGDFNLISYETRSIKREMKENEKGYLIEKKMLQFLNKPHIPSNQRKRDLVWQKVSNEMKFLRTDVFEKQVLRIFDFTAWIESKIRKNSLEEILNAKNQF